MLSYHPSPAQLVTALENEVNHSSEATEVDVLSWMGRTALELIGQAGLGYSFDPLVAESKDAFAESVKSFVSVSPLLSCAPKPLV